MKVPSGEGDFDSNWRQKRVVLITKDRVIDASLRAQIDSKKLFICQQNFMEDQFHQHENNCTLVPGAIPAFNIPIQSIPSSTITKGPRESASAIALPQFRDNPLPHFTVPVSCSIKLN